jgi:hypothetical protein
MKTLYTVLTMITLSALHIACQAPVRAESPLNLELKRMLKECKEPKECQLILNVLKKRGVK